MRLRLRKRRNSRINRLMKKRKNKKLKSPLKNPMKKAKNQAIKNPKRTETQLKKKAKQKKKVKNQKPKKRKKKKQRKRKIRWWSHQRILILTIWRVYGVTLGRSIKIRNKWFTSHLLLSRVEIS